MNSQDKLNDGASGEKLSNASRRRFARAGIASPVVLASLASKPVLGAVPKHCTVSGKISGNVSQQTGGTESCVIGQSRAAWLSNPTWPTITKGNLPGPTCAFAAGESAGTPFNGFGTALASGGLAQKMFFAAGADGCKVSTAIGTPASFYQVLAEAAPDTPTLLAQAVTVSLLNYYELGINYPVTGKTIVDMFNATVNGGTYPVNETQSWDVAQVLSYLTSLYPM